MRRPPRNRGAAPKPFDSTTKRLVEMRPADWLAYLGLPAASVEVIDAGLSTVTADADRVLRTGGPERLVHIEFESGHDTARVPGRLHRYNALLDYEHQLPVDSAVVLLSRASDSPALSGVYTRERPDGSGYLRFEYGVVRVWERPVEQVLTAGVATLPLAPLADVTQDDLPGVVRRMEERIAAETSTEEGRELWAATLILMGLRYPPAFTGELLKGVRQMKESSTYQAILAEGENIGRTNEARRVVFRLGTLRFGDPSPAARKTLDGIDSVERLEALIERAIQVESWDELLR